MSSEIFKEIETNFRNFLRPGVRKSRTQILINDLPLKLLEIIIVGVFITTNITVIQKTAEVGYDIFFTVFNSIVIYIPIFYIFLIYTMAYSQKELLSDKRMRISLYVVAILAILISMAQITEFRPLLKENLCYDQFVNGYINNCSFHALCCIILFIVLFFVRVIILRRGMYLFLILNFLFIRFWWGKAVIQNLDELFSKITAVSEVSDSLLK